MFSIVNGVPIGRDAFVTVVNLYNMNSFCCKLCKGIGQGDPEKCNSLCIYCSNVLLTRDLNEIQTKKSQPNPKSTNEFTSEKKKCNIKRPRNK